MDNDRTTSGSFNTFLATLAVIIAIIALVFSWIAYNRTGEDLEDQISREVNSAVQNSGEAVQDATDAIEEGVDNGPDGVDDGSR